MHVCSACAAKAEQVSKAMGFDLEIRQLDGHSAPVSVMDKLDEVNEHVEALCVFLEERGLTLGNGVLVLLVATGHLVGHLQRGDEEAKADAALEAFLDIVRQAAQLKRHQAKRPPL